MEVHAHSHLASGETHSPRKKWTHYFWEFLMLFLAVFCGFLAEYQLEHKIEKDRGKQYILSFYEDLKADTARMTNNIEIETKKIETLANLKDCYDILIKNPGETTCFFNVIKNSAFNHPFEITDRTLQQLANAGGYRLLEKEDADSILSYENQVKNIRSFHATAYQDAQDKVRNTFNSVVDFPANISLYSNIANSQNEYNPESKVLLSFSKDMEQLNKYFNELFQYLRVTVNHRNQMIRMKQKATELLIYFDQKHHL